MLWAGSVANTFAKQRSPDFYPRQFHADCDTNAFTDRVSVPFAVAVADPHDTRHPHAITECGPNGPSQRHANSNADLWHGCQPELWRASPPLCR